MDIELSQKLILALCAGVSLVTCLALSLLCTPALSCKPGFCSLNGTNDCTVRVETLTCEEPDKTCNNHGDCITIGDDVTCICHQGFIGTSCQNTYSLAVPACADSDACMNGGTCIERNSEYTCTCPSGFHGNRCELKTRTYTPDEDVCNNGGTAYRHGDSKRCVCPCGYTGIYCDRHIYFVCNYSQCDLQCDGDYRCELDSECEAYCKYEEDTERANDSTGTFVIVFVVLGSAIVLVLVAVFIGKRVMECRREDDFEDGDDVEQERRLASSD